LVNGNGSHMEVCGIGLVTDAWQDIREFAVSRILQRGGRLRETMQRALAGLEMLDADALRAHDALAQLVLNAAHQACSMADMLDSSGKLTAGEQMGMLFITSWGTIDSTVGYLESMLEENGRYASPRHFSRSVSSSVAAAAAIHFGMHGPCETLCFPDKPITGGLQSARRLLAAERCQRILVVWGEQSAEIARELSQMALGALGKREFARYANHPLGFGAVALVLGPPSQRHSTEAIAELTENAIENENTMTHSGKPFPMDGAVKLIEQIFVPANVAK
jgi:Beta-ketoacyl synthase, N-terminal domain